MLIPYCIFWAFFFLFNLSQDNFFCFVFLFFMTGALLQSNPTISFSFLDSEGRVRPPWSGMKITKKKEKKNISYRADRKHAASLLLFLHIVCLVKLIRHTYVSKGTPLALRYCCRYCTGIITVHYRAYIIRSSTNTSWPVPPLPPTRTKTIRYDDTSSKPHRPPLLDFFFCLVWFGLVRLDDARMRLVAELGRGEGRRDECICYSQRACLLVSWQNA